MEEVVVYLQEQHCTEGTLCSHEQLRYVSLKRVLYPTKSCIFSLVCQTIRMTLRREDADAGAAAAAAAAQQQLIQVWLYHVMLY